MKCTLSTLRLSLLPFYSVNIIFFYLNKTNTNPLPVLPSRFQIIIDKSLYLILFMTPSVTICYLVYFFCSTDKSVFNPEFNEKTRNIYNAKVEE